MYSVLCYVQADLSHIPKYPKTSLVDKGHYYRIDFDVVLSLGLTEIKAYIAWKESVNLLLYLRLTCDLTSYFHDFTRIWRKGTRLVKSLDLSFH